MSLLEVNHVTKRFGGLTAVNRVDFAMEQGQILGLIGPNGAGKTTVFNLITGIYQPDEGSILLDGVKLAGLRPHQITSLGVARTFQTIRLFKNLTARDNCMAGRYCRTKAGIVSAILRPPSQRAEERGIGEDARRYLETVGLSDQEDMLAKNLPYGDQRRLEIARALATNPRLIILDEPAGGLNEQESGEMMLLIKRIRDSGVTVLLIEHDMTVVMGISDRIVVLDYGEKIAEGTPAEVQANPRVIEAYLGKEEEEI